MTYTPENSSTLAEVTDRLQDFLTSKEDENIVLTGAWGTGKTQAWKRVVDKISSREVSFLHFRVWSFFFFCELFLLYLSSLLYLLTYRSFFSSLLFSLLWWLPFYLCLSIFFWHSFQLFLLVFLSKRFSRKRYAYVSVCDCATVKDLEDKIFASLVSSWRIGKSPSFLRSFVLNGAGATSIVTVLVALVLFCVLICQPQWLQSVAATKGFSIAGVVTALILGISTFFQLPFNFWQHFQRRWSLKDAIICIDDIERASKKLEPQEILNLAADLKENKNCKVALILNDDEFYPENKEKILLISKLEKRSNSDKDALKYEISLAEDKTSELSKKLSKKELWRKILEKGSDTDYKLILNAQDAAILAFTDNKGKKISDEENALVWALRSQVQEYDVQINNIRIIHRIQKDLERWSGVVSQLSAEDRALKEESWTQLRKNSGFSKETFEQSLWHKLAIIGTRQGKARYGTEGQKADGLTGEIIKYLNHFSQRDFKISWSKDNKEINGLIKLYVNNTKLEVEALATLRSILEKERKALKTLIQQQTDKFQRQTIEAPIRAVIFEDSPKEKVKKGLDDLKELLTNKEDFISEIGLSAMNYLLYLAERVEMKGWSNTFRECYIKNLQKQKDDFFSSWPDKILLGKDNEMGLTAYPMPTDIFLQQAFEKERNTREEKRKKEVEEKQALERRNKNYLKVALKQLSYSSYSFDFDQYKDVYEGWTLDTLIKTLKEFSIDERLSIVENYWDGAFTEKVPREYRGMSNFPVRNNILEELKLRKLENNWTDLPQPLDNLRIFQKLGCLIYKALKDYQETHFMMDYALEQELKKERWKELIEFPIPTPEEIAKQAETSSEKSRLK